MWSWPVLKQRPSVLLLRAGQTSDLDPRCGGTVEYAQRRSARGGGWRPPAIPSRPGSGVRAQGVVLRGRRHPGASGMAGSVVSLRMNSPNERKARWLTYSQ